MWGRITHPDSVLSLESQASYSDHGNYLSSTTDSLGNTTEYDYDTLTGLLESVTDANQNKVRYTYDAKGRVVGLEAVNGNQMPLSGLDYTYADGRLETITTAEEVYTLGYDSFGNMTGVTVGNTALANYTYAPNNGNLLRMTYGNGLYVDYAYDALDRVRVIRHNGNVVYTCAYNAQGQISRIEDTTPGFFGQWSKKITYYEYDSIGRLIRSRIENFDGTLILGVELEYDAQSRVVGQRYIRPDRRDTYRAAYLSDSNLIESFTLPNGVEISYAYDVFERSTSRNILHGAAIVGGESYAYVTDTVQNRTTTLVSEKQLSVSGTRYGYTYDAVGNITTVTKNGQPYVSYEYDGLNQLVRENNKASNQTYVTTYDSHGNIQRKYTLVYDDVTPLASLNLGSNYKQYSYDDPNWGDKLTAYNNTTISYDALGNPTNWHNAELLEWEGRQLKAHWIWSDVFIQYRYDANGARTGKTYYHDGGGYYVESDYILDGSRILSERRVHTEWLYYPEVSVESVLHYYYDASGSVIGLNYEGEDYYYGKNLQGDIVEIYKDGQVVVTYEYDAWGKILSIGGSMKYSLGRDNPFRYRGYYYDIDTGFYYLQSRYYDPEVGRFLNADGYVSTGQGNLSANMFAYCENNPVNCFDPDGRMILSFSFIAIIYEKLMACIATAAVAISAAIAAQKAIDAVSSSGTVSIPTDGAGVSLPLNPDVENPTSAPISIPTTEDITGQN